MSKVRVVGSIPHYVYLANSVILFLLILTGGYTQASKDLFAVVLLLLIVVAPVMAIDLLAVTLRSGYWVVVLA